MGGALGGHAPLLEPGAPMKRELQWKNWLTQAVKVVIVNCNGTIVVVPFVQCQ